MQAAGLWGGAASQRRGWLPCQRRRAPRRRAVAPASRCALLRLHPARPCPAAATGCKPRPSIKFLVMLGRMQVSPALTGVGHHHHQLGADLVGRLDGRGGHRLELGGVGDGAAHVGAHAAGGGRVGRWVRGASRSAALPRQGVGGASQGGAASLWGVGRQGGNCIECSIHRQQDGRPEQRSHDQAPPPPPGPHRGRCAREAMEWCRPPWSEPMEACEMVRPSLWRGSSGSSSLPRKYSDSCRGGGGGSVGGGAVRECSRWV